MIDEWFVVYQLIFPPVSRTRWSMNSRSSAEISVSGKVANWFLENSRSQNVGNCQTSETDDQGSDTDPAPEERDRLECVAMSSACGVPIARSFWIELR